MSPPLPGPTLRVLVERLRAGARSVILGPYCSTIEVARNDDCIEVWALHGAVIGVSAVDDRPPERAALITEAVDLDDLVTKLMWLWTRDYSTMFAEGDRLFGKVTGNRRDALHGLRQYWPGGVGVTDAMAV